MLRAGAGPSASAGICHLFAVIIEVRSGWNVAAVHSDTILVIQPSMMNNDAHEAD
jgi:hypothetical protein